MLTPPSSFTVSAGCSSTDLLVVDSPLESPAAPPVGPVLRNSEQLKALQLKFPGYSLTTLQMMLKASLTKLAAS